MLLHQLLDRRADRCPAEIAVRRGEVCWSYAQLRARSLAIADWLRRNGVRRGDRVLLLAAQNMETVAAVFAASRLGAVYVVVHQGIQDYGLAHIVADCEPMVVLAEAPADRLSVVDGSALVVPFPEHAARSLPGRLPPSGGLSSDPVSLIYTSGSTAAPKAVVSTHRQVLFATKAIQARLRYQPSDVVFCCLPLSFDYGLYQVFLTVAAGAQLVLGDAVDAGPALPHRIAELGVTVLPVVPSMAGALTKLLRRSGRRRPALRLITNTGADLTDGAAAELEALTASRVVRMFGLTECKRVAIEHGPRRPGSSGIALPGTEFYTVDDRRARLPAGEVGELVVRGPHVMSGYWRAPELTAARFGRDEFGQPLLFTGDLCRVDGDGHLYFVGRQDDVYKQNGFRVSATEVEAAALDIPGVDAAALLVPGPGHGSVLAVTGSTPHELVVAELARRLERFKLPDQCRVLDILPLKANGKVDKRALAGLAAVRP